MEPKNSVTPDDVLKFDQACDKFLCPMDSNKERIQFIHYKLRDTKSNMTLYEINNDVLSEEDF